MERQRGECRRNPCRGPFHGIPNHLRSLAIKIVTKKEITADGIKNETQATGPGKRVFA
jgi:hypothetical protein